MNLNKGNPMVVGEPNWAPLEMVLPPCERPD